MKFFSKSVFKIVLIIFVLAFIGIQFKPVKRDNPPVKVQVKWDSSRTKELFTRACKDCHSNETVYPWYSRIAPASWLLERDVVKGRKKMNISVDDDLEASEITKSIKKGTMPYWPFLIIHSEARLTDAEKADLIKGLEKTFPDLTGDDIDVKPISRDKDAD